MDAGASGRRAETLTESRQKAELNKPRNAWFVLLLLALVNAVNYMDRWVMSVLLQPIKLDLHLSDTQMGLLTGMAFSLSYAIFALPMARLADQRGRRLILSGAIAVWSVMTAWAGYASGFAQLLLARIGVGAGEAGCIPTGQSLITDYFPPRLRAFALSVFSAGSMLGKVIGIGAAGFLVSAFGWHITLLAMSLPGMVLAAVVAIAVKDPGRGCFEPATSGTIGLYQAIGSLVATRSYVLITLALAFSNFVISGVQTWSPTFYMRAHGLTASQVGAAIATVVGVGSAAGLLVGGWSTQRLIERDPRWAMWAASGLTIVAGACSVLSFEVPSARPSLLLSAAAAIILNLPTGAIFAAQLGCVDPRTRTLAAAVSLTLISIIGLGLGPLVVGAMSDWFRSTGGLRVSLALTASFNLLPAIFYGLAGRGLVADLDRHNGKTPSGVSP